MTSVWDDPKFTARVVARYRADEGCMAIAKSLGLTRNAVTSKLDRMGVLKRHGPVRLRVAKPAAPKAPKPKPEPAPARIFNPAAIYRGDPRTSPLKKKLDAIVANEAARAAPFRAEARVFGETRVPPVLKVAETDAPRIEPAQAFAPLPGSSPKPWTERRFGECTWTVGGEGADALSCCEPVKARGWCRAHFARGVAKPATDAQRQAAAKAREAKRRAA